MVHAQGRARATGGTARRRGVLAFRSRRKRSCTCRGCSDRDRDWVEIFVGIGGDLVIQGRVDDEVGRNNEYGIAVRCCPCPLTHSEVAAGTTNVFDIELFSEMLGQLLCDETGEYVGWTAGCERHDHP